MTRFYTIENEYYLLSGETYSIRDRIKELGGRWDSKQRLWKISNSGSTLDALVNFGFFENRPNSSILSSVDAASQSLVNESTAPSLTVQQLSTIVYKLIQSTFVQSFWVVGEVSGLRRSGRNTYFDLVDSDSKNFSELGRVQKTVSLNCALWGDRFEKIADKLKNFNLDDGLKIRVLCGIEYRRDNGRIVLQIEEIDREYSEGNIALHRQNLVSELKRRNLYDRNKKLQKIFFGFRIALLTSDGSRAMTDFIDELNRSELPFKIFLYDVHMQGAETSSDICEAFSRIETRSSEIDFVVLTRGGGSRLDLRWFDDLEICKKIAHCSRPVLSAIGHFDDVSVADEVSFAAEKTPTGAARYLIESITADRNAVTNLFLNIGRLSSKRILRETNEILRQCTRIGMLAKTTLERRKNKVEQFSLTLRVLKSSIDNIKAKGFSLVRTEDGQAINPREIDPNRQSTLLLDFRYKENNVFFNKRVYVTPNRMETEPEYEAEK